MSTFLHALTVIIFSLCFVVLVLPLSIFVRVFVDPLHLRRPAAGQSCFILRSRFAASLR